MMTSSVCVQGESLFAIERHHLGRGWVRLPILGDARGDAAWISGNADALAVLREGHLSRYEVPKEGYLAAIGRVVLGDLP